jgi:hypothetical protein
MAITFEEYVEAHIGAVEQFNLRIRESVGSDLLFLNHPLTDWLPKGGHPKIFQEGVLAREGEVVRGGYVLKHQDFVLNGEVRRVSSYRLPVSEGVVSRAYASLALQMLRNALGRQPLLFSLGMGSLDRPLPKMQKALGWNQYSVPFYFKVLHGGRFSRNIAPLRTTAARRAALDLAAWSGAASLFFAAWRAARRGRLPSGLSVESFGKFGSWADELWARCKGRYSLIAVRDRDVLNTLYPVADRRFLRWKVMTEGRLLGWAVCLDTPMRGHKQFGDMRVATIVDCLADPDDADAVVGAVTHELMRGTADLIVSNQMHESWAAGLTAAGFLSGPSNYIFSASPKLSQALAPFSTQVKRGHITRADGDGPLHL